MQWEADFLLFLQNYVRNDYLKIIMNALSSMMNYGIMVIALIIFLLVYKKTRSIGVVALIALLVSVIINNLILKNMVARVRPYDAIEGLMLIARKPNDYSFPSGHSANVFVVTGVITWCAKRDKKWIGILLLVLSGFIAFSRMYLGAHYPTDVIFGVMSGLIISIVIYFLIWKRIEKSSDLKSIDKTELGDE